MASMELIKKLRDMTQAGVMDAKKALEANNDDIDASVQWLREKGMARAAKKATAVATEGVAKVVIRDDLAVIFEMNCQTDFVAMGENFLNFANDVGLTLVMGGENDINKAVKELKLSTDNSIEVGCLELGGKIGEKIALRRFEIIKKAPGQQFAYYEHSNRKIAVLLLIDKEVPENIAKDISMHAAAMAPKFLGKDQVDQEWLANETKILREQTIAEGKPAERADQIVKGRVNKLLGEVTLENQAFVKEPGVTVANYLGRHSGAKALTYYRFQVGEGIEKEVVDFAAEVAAQMSAANK